MSATTTPTPEEKAAARRQDLISFLKERSECEPSGIIVTVVGSGSFGTALAYVLGCNGHEVRLVCRTAESCNAVNTMRRNPKYLAGIDYELPPNVTASCDLRSSLTNCNFILHAVPAQASLQYLKEIRPLLEELAPTAPIISVSKGLCGTPDKMLLMRDVFLQALDTTEEQRPLAFLSGPSFAKELVQRYPTGVVVASSNPATAAAVQKLFSSTFFRVYTSEDVIGVELAGALKNIFAIGAGVVAGCGFGYNSVTGLVTRGLFEMRQLCEAMGARPDTVAGLAGVGDLMLTCFGALSRNRSVGFRLGQGESLAEIIGSMSEVAEGVPTAAVAYRLALEHKLDLPIIRAVNKLIQGESSVHDALLELMSRPPRPEFN